jgi:ABC-type sugar transport system ATPase subunit
VQALSDVDLDVRPGEVHALLGPNGAGKSTLARIIGGAEAPDGGEIWFAGEQVVNHSPGDAAARGIGVVHQNLNLFPSLSVAENLSRLVGFATSGPLISWRAERRAARDLLGLLEHQGIDPGTAVSDLSVGEAWMVTLTAALAKDPTLLLLDESTAALSFVDAERLFSALRERVEAGLAVLVVTHRLAEIRQLADRITVLRGGAVAGSVEPDASTDELIQLMYGPTELEVAREVGSLVRREVDQSAEPICRLDRASTPRLSNVTIELRPGEIFGLAGALGSGRSEVIRTIGGIRRLTGGSMELEGKAFNPRSPRRAIARGVVVVPENRDANGVFPGLSVSRNMTASSISKFLVSKSPLVNRDRERREVDRMIGQFGIHGKRGQEITTLSGGNRQKVLLGRAMLAGAKILLLDDPTSGLDIASRAEMARSIHQFAREDGAVMVASDELDELLRICTKIGVMRDGELRATLTVSDELTEQKIAGVAYG